MIAPHARHTAPIRSRSVQLALLALLALGSTLPAAAQVRTLSTPTVEPAQVQVGVKEKVRIWADVSDPNVIASGVNLLKVGAPGTNPTIVGVLKDDGTGGDEIAGDGRFSIELTVNEPAAKTFVYRISAPFKGTLLRTVTPDLPLAVVANRLPVAVPGASQAVRAGAVVQLDGRASYDLDGDLLRFRWTLTPPAGSAAVLDSVSYVKPSFIADVAGAYLVQLVVNDGHVDSVLKELTVTASSGNSAPTARLVPISSPFAPASSVALTGGGSFDPDGQLLTYAWTLKGKPATSTTASLTATTGATPQLLPDKPGRYVIELTVNDGSANSAPTQALVTLYTPNTPPAVNAGADQSGKPTAGVVNLAGTIGVDPEGDSVVNVQWTFIAKPTGSTATLVNATSLTPSFTPDQPGDYLVELAVTDSRAALGKARLVVRAITLPPVAINLLSANPGSGTVPLAVNFNAEASGGTGSYNYGWTFGDSTTSATQNPSHTYTQVGTFNATVTATDGQNHSASKSVPITVNPVVVVTNQAPQVNAGPNQAVALPALATLTGSATDDGLPNPPHQLTYLWSLVSGPTGPAITDPTLPATTALFPTPGTYVLRLTASDSALSGSGTVTITVSDVGPSLQPIADRTIALGSRLQLELVANDGNPTDQLTYSLLVGPTGAAVNPSPRLQWTPSASQLGTHTFTVQVTDAYGHGDSKSFHVTVVQGNQSPLLAVQAAATLPRGATFSRTLTATDPDSQPLTFALTAGPAGMTLTGADLHWPTGNFAPGDYPVTVKVTDSGALFDAKRFIITVTPAAPPVASDDRYEVNLGQSLTIPAPGVLANDIDPMGGSLTAAKLTGPDKGTLSAFDADGSFTFQAPAIIDKTFQPVVKWISQSNIPGMSMRNNLRAVDVDGDGKPELVIDHPSANIWGEYGLSVLHGKDGSVLWGQQTLYLPLPAPNDQCVIMTWNAPDVIAVGDVDDSGAPAIVVPVVCPNGPSVTSGPINRLAALDARTGAVKWLSPMLSQVREVPGTPGYGFDITNMVRPAIARLRPGEKPSVLFKKTMGGWDQKGNYYCNDYLPGVSSSNCTVVTAVDGATGAVRQVWAAFNDYYSPGNERGGFVLVADLTGSGTPNIIADTAVWDLNGTLLNNRRNGRWVMGLALANLDNSGQTAIISFEIANSMGYLVARKPDGQVLWETPTDANAGSVSGQVVVADLYGDGMPKIMVTTLGNLYVFDEHGALVWTHRFVDAANNPTIATHARPVVFDLDGDGVSELIMQTGYGVEIFDGKTGAVKANVRYTDVGYPDTHPYQSASSSLTPLVIDVDGDGHAEVVFNIIRPYYPLTSWVVALGGKDNDWQPARPVWNQFAMHDANVTDTGHIPYPEANNFATPRTNVFANPARIAPPVDPRKREQATFTYKAQAGGLDSNASKVTIDLVPPNRPPVFTSVAPTTYIAYSNSYPAIVPFLYQAHAVDPDPGDTVTYSIVSKGGSLEYQFTIDPITGKLECKPLIVGSNSGPLTFLLAATDSSGASAYQTIKLQPSTGFAAVPNVVGQSKTSADATLAAAGFATGNVSSVYFQAPVDQVLTQFPAAGASVLKGEAIALQVSLGPQPVLVPLVVGQPLTVANTALTTPGFTVAVNRVFSNTEPLNTVLAQSVAAGTLLSPTTTNPVTLTISAGNGLRLAVNRSIATAEQTITVSPTAFDANGNPAALPALTYAITPALTPYVGPLPTIAGLNIAAGPATQGAFRVTATDAANGRSASADFVVLPPPEAGGVTHGQAYAQMAAALDAIFALKQPLIAARDANNLPQMRAVVQQMVTLWRGVDIDDLKISMPLVTADQFAPSLGDLGALGLSATTDDVVIRQILRDAADDLRAWTDALKAQGTPIAQLNALADQFSTRAARLDGLVVSEYGGIYNQRQYTLLLSHRIPAFYEALFEELAASTGLPPRTPAFPGLKRRPALKSTLAEQLTVIAVNYVVEKIMDEASKTYKNAKELAHDTMKQAAWTAAAVGIASHLKSSVLGGDVFEVISGASLSFRVFNDPVPDLAIVEVPADFEAPELTSVMIIGPDTVADTTNGVKDLFKKMKDGFSYGLNVVTNLKKYKNFNQVKQHMKEFMAKLKAIKQSATNVQDTIDNAYQAADDVLPGCIFTSDPSCAQLVYYDGIKPVYRYTAPAGLTSLSGLPVPIVFIVQNQYTGLMYFGTPIFMPAPKKTP